MAAPERNETFAFVVVLAGLALVAMVFWISANKWSDAKDVIGVVGAVAGIIGTLAGAYFGVKVGQGNRQQLQDENRKLHVKIARIAAEPAEARRIIAEP